MNEVEIEVEDWRLKGVMDIHVKVVCCSFRGVFGNCVLCMIEC